jgi:hypothetical protein
VGLGEGAGLVVVEGADGLGGLVDRQQLDLQTRRGQAGEGQGKSRRVAGWSVRWRAQMKGWRKRMAMAEESRDGTDGGEWRGMR